LPKKVIFGTNISYISSNATAGLFSS